MLLAILADQLHIIMYTCTGFVLIDDEHRVFVTIRNRVYVFLAQLMTNRETNGIIRNTMYIARIAAPKLILWR